MQQLTIIGNGMSALRLVQELKRLTQDFTIRILANEPHGNYNRIQLAQVLARRLTLEQIQLQNLDWYRQEGIALVFDEAEELDVANQRIVGASGQSYAYDQLVFATGSRPRFPRIPGIDHKSVVGLMIYRKETFQKCLFAHQTAHHLPMAFTKS